MTKGKAKIIVNDGSDCSFKETQSKMLCEALERDNIPYLKLSYPDYESETSALVRMYLAGKFGKNADLINPYIASSFYAVDRIGSFLMNWQELCEQDIVIVMDRYVTSNMIHQASKIEDIDEKNKFLDWLWDMEYSKFGLPIPDEVIFLNMPYENSLDIMKKRDNKITGESSKDIHEGNADFIKKSYENSCWIAKKYNWKEVMCVSDEISENGLRSYKSREAIHNEVYDIVKEILKK